MKFLNGDDFESVAGGDILTDTEVVDLSDEDDEEEEKMLIIKYGVYDGNQLIRTFNTFRGAVNFCRAQGIPITRPYGMSDEEFWRHVPEARL